MTKPKKKTTKSKVAKTVKKPVLKVAENTEVIPEVVLEVEAPQETETVTSTTLEVSKTNKLAKMVEMLSKPEGETLKTLAETLGWKENSVRGAMSLYAKKHKEYQLISEKLQGIRTYRLSKVLSD